MACPNPSKNERLLYFLDKSLSFLLRPNLFEPNLFEPNLFGPNLFGWYHIFIF